MNGMGVLPFVSEGYCKLSSELQFECSNHSNGDNGGQWREGSETAEVKRREFWTFHLYLFIGVRPLERLLWCYLKKQRVYGNVSSN